MKVTSENGRSYNLSKAIISKLQAAKTADRADMVFYQEAPHVLARDRCGIWLAADYI